MGLRRGKTLVVTALAVAGLATSGQALARQVVVPPEADVAAAALVTETIVRPDDRAVRVSPPQADAVADAVRPDDRAVRVTPVSPETAVRPDDRAVRVTPVDPGAFTVRPDDRPGVRGPGAAPEAAPAPVTIVPGGFDLGDAAIGAGFALGLVLLLLLGIQAIRGRRPLAH